MDQKTIRNIGTAVLIAVLLITYVVRVVRKPDQPPPPDAPVESHDQGAPSSGIADASVHLALGNPSDATDDPANANNYLMRKTYFALSYNNSKGGAELGQLVPEGFGFRNGRTDSVLPGPGPAPRLPSCHPERVHGERI